MLAVFALFASVLAQTSTLAVPSISSAAVAIPSSTGTPDCPVYDQCRMVVNTSWRDGACVQLQATNATYYTQCLCYYQVEAGKCFLQCPNNSAVQSELTSTVQPAIASSCKAAGLNPLALPPAAWAPAVASVVGGAKSSASAAMATSTGSTNGAEQNGIMLGFFGAAALLF
jgi:hypothetical protein